MIAASGRRNPVRRGRKVRTPQGSVPDNVRDGRRKPAGRPVQQKTNRLSLSVVEGIGKGETAG